MSPPEFRVSKSVLSLSQSIPEENKGLGLDNPARLQLQSRGDQIALF